MKHEIDTGLIVTLLRNHGHTVGHVIPIPDNGGEFEFEVDGTLLSLAEARGLLEAEDNRQEVKARPSSDHTAASSAGPVATP